MNYINDYFRQAVNVLNSLPYDGQNFSAIEAMVDRLSVLKKNGGRLFILGNGGSAANASHAVNDFRKIAGIEAYTPTDNVAELTARINDDGGEWDYAYSSWLRTSQLRGGDALLILSVGGGDLQAVISRNILGALALAQEYSTPILSIVSRDGGYVKKNASKNDVCLLIPVVDERYVTPFAESFQALVWHCIVNHPALISEEKEDA